MANVASEYQEQVTFVQWCRLNKIPVFAIPNGFWLPLRNKRALGKYIAKRKKEGYSPGVPDLFIPVPRGEHHGLFVEMKRHGGTLSNEQKRWLTRLNENGYLAVVCYGAKEAIEKTAEYLDGAAE